MKSGWASTPPRSNNLFLSLCQPLTRSSNTPLIRTVSHTKLGELRVLPLYNRSGSSGTMWSAGVIGVPGKTERLCQQKAPCGLNGN
uniref:Uncharacterized protein n=1 Tax=Anguilla anguilla TaxID=7936 RepID=A0A0E9TMI2_ANGAN